LAVVANGKKGKKYIAVGMLKGLLIKKIIHGGNEMNIKLTDNQIKNLKSKAIIETDREIYSIKFDGQEITINYDWSIERNEKPIHENIIEAIETYCTKSNIDWEFNSTYSAWCN
jgi:hypothetical protein